MPTDYLRIFASNGDGKCCVMGQIGGDLFCSSDGGVSWKSAQLPPGFWETISVSRCGKFMIAGQATHNGKLFRSADFGNTWTPVNLRGNNWCAVAVSVSG